MKLGTISLNGQDFFAFYKLNFIIVFDALIRASFVCKDFSKTRLFWEDMQRLKIAPKQTTCVAVINHCAEVGTTDALNLGVLAEKVGTFFYLFITKLTLPKLGRGSVGLDIDLSSALLRLFHKCGEPTKALQIWKSLLDSGKAGQISQPTLVSVLTICADMGPAGT